MNPGIPCFQGKGGLLYPTADVHAVLHGVVYVCEHPCSQPTLATALAPAPCHASACCRCCPLITQGSNYADTAAHVPAIPQTPHSHSPSTEHSARTKTPCRCCHTLPLQAGCISHQCSTACLGHVATTVEASMGVCPDNASQSTSHGVGD